MNTKDIGGLFKGFGRTISKNSPTILAGLAVGGVITSVIFAVEETPKAMSVIDGRVWEKYEEEVEDPDETSFGSWLGVGEDYDWSDRLKKLSKKEIIQLTWKFYIPSASIGILTIACIIGSNTINYKRTAALASAYGITEAAFREYKDKVVETIGKNKELQVRDEISSDKLKKNPVSENEVIFTGKGDVLCYDCYNGRYFDSDMEKIRQAINELNEMLLTDMFVSLNDFYYALGLSNVKSGNHLGFDLDDGLIDISFSTQLSDTGKPCLVLNYDVSPRFIK